MSIQFDEHGAANCPSCGEVIGNTDRYCGHCGLKLPVPTDPDVQEFQEEFAIANHVSRHKNPSFEKDSCGHAFCTLCGQKLHQL